jgi:hypothetical protein
VQFDPNAFGVGRLDDIISDVTLSEEGVKQVGVVKSYCVARPVTLRLVATPPC